MARKDDALGDGAAWDEQEAPNAPRRDRRRGVFITAAGAGLALALVGGLLFVQRGDAADEAASAPVALSPDGLSPHVSAEQLAAGLPVAQKALKHTLAAPAKADSKVPPLQLRAYRRAEATLAAERSSCHLNWSLLAGIGKVESDHAADRTIDGAGNVTPLVRGPRLDGSVIGTQMVLDTDQGIFDQDPQFDRAMGPMQFVPGTWRIAGRDGDGDGKISPDNVFDAAVTAANYVCSAGDDLATPEGMTAAVLRYNNHPQYLVKVLEWATYYDAHLHPAPEDPAPPSNATVQALPAPTVTPTTPAVTPTPTVPSTGPTPPDVPITVPSTTSPAAPAPAVPVPAVPTKGTSATKTTTPASPSRTTTTAPAPSTTTSTSQAPSTPSSHTSTSEAPAPVTSPTSPRETPTSTAPAGSVSPSEAPSSSASSTHTQSASRVPSTPAEPSSASGAPAPTGSDLPALPDDPAPSGTHSRSSR